MSYFFNDCGGDRLETNNPPDATHLYWSSDICNFVLRFTFFYWRYSSEIDRRINDRLIFGAKSIESGIDFARIDELFLPGAENSEYYAKSHKHLSAMRKVFGLKYLYSNPIQVV